MTFSAPGNVTAAGRAGRRRALRGARRGRDGAADAPAAPLPGGRRRARPHAADGDAPHAAAARELRGSFAADPSGIKTVKLRLTKRLGKRCWYFSGRMERFRRTQLRHRRVLRDRRSRRLVVPAARAAERGRYVLDAIAIDGAGNRTPLERGTHAGGVHRPMRRLAVIACLARSSPGAASAPARRPAARSP